MSVKQPTGCDRQGAIRFNVSLYNITNLCSFQCRRSQSRSFFLISSTSNPNNRAKRADRTERERREKRGKRREREETLDVPVELLEPMRARWLCAVLCQVKVGTAGDASAECRPDPKNTVGEGDNRRGTERDRDGWKVTKRRANAQAGKQAERQSRRSSDEQTNKKKRQNTDTASLGGPSEGCTVVGFADESLRLALRLPARFRKATLLLPKLAAGLWPATRVGSFGVSSRNQAHSTANATPSQHRHWVRKCWRHTQQVASHRTHTVHKQQPRQHHRGEARAEGSRWSPSPCGRIDTMAPCPRHFFGWVHVKRMTVTCADGDARVLRRVSKQRRTECMWSCFFFFEM